MNEKIFRVIVPVADPKPRRAKFLSYPCSGCQLYTAQEAVKVMESFGRKCIRRTTEGDELEVWAESEHCRFTLKMWIEDCNGVRTDNSTVEAMA